MQSEKAKLRKHYRQLRNNISSAEQLRCAQLLVKQFKTKINKRNLPTSCKIAVYLANDGELETEALIKYFWSVNFNVYVPVLDPEKSGHLLFLQYEHSTPMTNNQYGISEPELNLSKVSPISDLDIVFLPLVAFDSMGGRLGMGGGYYDRSLALIKNNKPRLIGLAHDIQKADNLPRETWDVPLNEILSPTQHIDLEELNK